MILWLAAGCGPGPVTVETLPVPDRELGVLTPIAALELSGDRDFGGWSAAALEPGQGTTLLVVNDDGAFMRWRLSFDGEGVLVGLDERGRGRLKDEAGEPLSGKALGDAESLVRDDDGWVVGFEQDHRLLRYEGDRPSHRATRLPLPEAFSAPTNGGFEALAKLGERFVGFVEGDEGGGEAHPGWIGAPGAWSPTSLPRTGTFRPVELAPMGPDLLLVERSYDEATDVSRSRLSRLPAAAFADGGPVAPIELGVLEGDDLPLDNFEAAAVVGSSVFLLSDDNFSSSQRTVLLQLRWRPPTPAVDGAAVAVHELDGRDRRELQRSCAERCPRDDQGRVVHGLTRWSVRWTWVAEPVVGADGSVGCRIGSPRAHTELGVDLPGWRPPLDADRAFVEGYPAYLDGLAAHEQRHVDLARRAAADGERRLPELRCEEAEGAVQGWLEDLRRAQAALDAGEVSGR